MPAPKIAVEPDWARPFLTEAVTAGGGVLAPLGEAEAMVWTSAEHPDELAEVLAAHPEIRWVQLPWAGIEPYRHVLDHDRVWTCGKGVYAEPVAEHALALLLGGMRHVAGYARAEGWSGPVGQNLLGAKVTILGGGAITESLLRLLGPFDATITVVRRHAEPLAGATTVVGPEGLDDALRDADAVVLALALTPETRGIIGARELALMGERCWLVNVARGAHIVTDDLVGALADGVIAGAALDVTDPEPLPDGHPLWSLPNAIITPHVANTPEMAVPLLSARVSENVRRWAAGEELLGPVHVDLGY